MAAVTRPMRRAAYNLTNIMKSCTSPLCNTNGPTHLLRMASGRRLLEESAGLLYQPRLLQFALGACGYCSQQIAQHSSTVHTCINTTNPNTTNDNTTTPHTTTTSTPLHHHTTTTSPLHLHQHQHHHTASVAARRINRRTELDFEELRALQLAGDIALIDVRDTQEIQNYGEIPGSLNIPLCKIKVALQLSEDDWEREFQIEKPDKSDRNLVFYARGPNASSTAVEIAHRLGFNRSRHYIGGWEDYCQQTGVPLKKPQDNGFNGPNFYMNKFDQYFL